MHIIGSLINSILFHIGAFLGSIFRRSYFAKAHNGKKVSEQTLLKIIRENENTEYGKKYGFSRIRSIDDYRQSVPLTVYDDYLDYIERSKNGEENLLTRKKIKSYAVTTGTTGVRKYIPQSPSTKIGYFKAICIFVGQCIDALRQRKVSTWGIRGFCNTEVTDNAGKGTNKENDGYSTAYASQYAAGAVKYFLPIFTQLPAEVVGCGEIEDKEYIKSRYALQLKDLKFIVGVFMNSVSFSLDYIEKNMEMLIEDIEKGTINPEIRMTDAIRKKLLAKIKPDPKRAAELRQIMNTPSDVPFVSRLWPQLSFIVAIGSGDFEPFTKAVKSKCVKDVTFCHSLYAASEALIAFAIRPNEASYLPMVDSAFYEFIPVDAADRNRTLLMSELEVDHLYEIVITSKAGLYRYQLKDVIRVVGFEGETPLIRFAYRANLITSVAKVNNDDFVFTIRDLENKYGLQTIDYSVYADFGSDVKSVRLFIEFDKNVDKETAASIEKDLEAGLCRNNNYYAACRANNELSPAKLHILKKNTYYDLRKKQIAAGASPNQLKALRVIKDDKILKYFQDHTV